LVEEHHHRDYNEDWNGEDTPDKDHGAGTQAPSSQFPSRGRLHADPGV